MKSIYMAIFFLSIFFVLTLMAVLFIKYGGKLGIDIERLFSSTIAQGKNRHDTKPKSAIDYDSYNMTLKERVVCITTAGGVIFAAGYIFYRSIGLAMFLLPLSLLYPRIRIKEIIAERKAELNMQFREALYSVSSSLSAGKSIEMSLRDAEKELSIQYPDPDTYILSELRQINRRVEMNETIEEALNDFVMRSHLEDIKNFAEVFAICKRTGGNLVQVVKNTAEIISEKIDVRQEINVLLTEKKLEHKILNLMPVVIVLLLSTSAEEFMAPVFSEVLGRIAMTVSLLLFAAAYFISKKIMNIEV
jgi:tight adherence protein B